MTLSTGAISIDTTSGALGGANISFSSTLNGAQNLTLNAGTSGTITFTGAVGGTNALTKLAFTNAQLIQVGARHYGYDRQCLDFHSSCQRDCCKRNCDYFGSGNGIVLNSTAPITVLNGGVNLTISSPGSGTYLSAGITTNGGTVTFSYGVRVDTTLAIDTTSGANILFNSTLDAETVATPAGLTLNAHSGSVTFSNTVGSNSPLGALNVTANSITFNNAVTTKAGAVTLTGPVTLASTAIAIKTTGGSSPAPGGANISFNGTLNGAQALTLNAGTSGTIAFSGVVGGSNPPTNITFTTANLIQIGANITVSGANALTFPYPVSLTNTSTINSNNKNISFSSTLNGAQALTLNAGASGVVAFNGVVGGSNPPTNIIFSNANLLFRSELI